ncbi:MAG TPA: alpha/beta hydrolase [Myxococcota bacterium]|nr:alpha/beta hydrolase [Myxococcota bacterium]
MGERLEFHSRSGLRLAAEASGDPRHDPVVLLHGGGQTRHAWGDTAQVLADRGWYSISVDLRGHGDSDWCPQGDYLLDAFADDVVSVVSQLARPAVLVGASLGGLASMVALGEPRFGMSARALVLVDVGTHLEPGGVERISSFMRARPEGYASIEEAANAVAEYQSRRPRPADLEGLRKNLRRTPEGRWRWHWDPRFLSGVVPESGRLESAARQLRLSTLLVRGRTSDMLSVEGARAFLELVPHASFEDVADAGHMVAGDRNDAFTQVVAGFLTRLRDRS